MENIKDLIPKPGDDVKGLPGFKHHYSNVNDTQIHYVMGGSGPAIVLLHGYPYTWEIWREILPLLAASNFTIIAPDLRGLGHSLKVDNGYAKRNVAEDIRQIVRLHGIDTISLVGMDIGTMVAYAYASAYPSEINHLVLSESIIPGFGLEEMMNPATGGFWHFGFHMQVDIAEMLTAGKEEAYLLPMMSMMSISADAAELAKSRFLTHYRSKGGMRAGFKHYETLIDDGKENQEQSVNKLKMPVLVLNGEIGLPQAMLLDGVKQIADKIESDIIPYSGHTFAEDNPTWVANRLTQFFNT